MGWANLGKTICVIESGLHAQGWAAPQGQFSLLGLGDASLKLYEKGGLTLEDDFPQTL